MKIWAEHRKLKQKGISRIENIIDVENPVIGFNNRLYTVEKNQISQNNISRLNHAEAKYVKNTQKSVRHTWDR